MSCVETSHSLAAIAAFLECQGQGCRQIGRAARDVALRPAKRRLM